MGGQVPGMMGPLQSGQGMGPQPSTGNFNPTLPPQGFGSTGPMPPTSSGRQVPGPGAPSPSLSATGQSMGPVTGNAATSMNPGNPQPPNAVTNQVPGIQGKPLGAQPAPTGAQSLGGGVQAPQGPLPPVSGLPPGGAGMPPPQPPQPQGQGVTNSNRVRTHNPTGDGTQQASVMAAAKRPAPATYPKKQQGFGTPQPSVVPGKS